MYIIIMFALAVCAIIGIVSFWRNKSGGYRTLSAVTAVLAVIGILVVLLTTPIREDLLPPPRPDFTHEIPTVEPGVGDAINTTDFNPDSI